MQQSDEFMILRPVLTMEGEECFELTFAWKKPIWVNSTHLSAIRKASMAEKASAKAV